MATIARAEATDQLEFRGADVVECGSRRHRCGGTTYRVLRSVYGAPPAGRGVAAFCRDVWGEGEEVSNVRVRVAIHRANVVLAGLRYPASLALTDGRVLLV